MWPHVTKRARPPHHGHDMSPLFTRMVTTPLLKERDSITQGRCPCNLAFALLGAGSTAEAAVPASPDLPGVKEVPTPSSPQRVREGIFRCRAEANARVQNYACAAQAPGRGPCVKPWRVMPFLRALAQASDQPGGGKPLAARSKQALT